MFLSVIVSTVSALFMSIDGLVAIGAGIAALTGLGASTAMGLMTSKAFESIARQPEVAGTIRLNLLVGLAFAETTALFGMVVSILLIFMA